MPRAGFAKHQLGDDLDDAMFEIRSFVKKTALGDLASAFTSSTHHGLFLGVGDSKFLFTPYTGDAIDDPPALSGLFSFAELKALPLLRPEPVVENLDSKEKPFYLPVPKVGKSRLAHQLAFALEDGTPFLGLDVPTRRRVLIVDLENRPGCSPGPVNKDSRRGSIGPGVCTFGQHDRSARMWSTPRKTASLNFR